MDKFTVLGADGTADVKASTAAYGKALTDWKATNEVPTEKIEAAVEAVFDKFVGVRLPMPALVHEAVSQLNGTPDQHKALSARVQAYVRGQCGLGDARNTGRIDIGRGKHGGCERLAKPGQEIPARVAKSA